MEPARLIGLWSDSEVYSGAMEHEVIFFGEDGFGCFAWENVYSTRGSVFTWALDDDRLTTRMICGFSRPVGEQDRLVAGDGLPFEVTAGRVALGREDGPCGTRPVVLRIDTGRPSSAFGYVRPSCPDDLLEQIHRCAGSREATPPA